MVIYFVAIVSAIYKHILTPHAILPETFGVEHRFFLYWGIPITMTWNR